MLSRHIAIPIALIRMRARTQLEYRGAFFLDRLAQIADYGSAFAAVYLLLVRFTTLGGWTWPQLALLLSFYLVCYSLGAAFSYTQLREIEELVRLGTFDVLLVRPYSAWAYLVFSGLNMGYAGHLVVGAALLSWAVGQVGIAWNVLDIVYLVASMLSAMMVVAAVLTIIGASALLLERSRHLYTVFFGFWELSRYPMTIYPATLQIILITVMPLGFMGYVPVAVLLGKPVPMLGDYAGAASLGAGPIMALLAVLFWRYAINRYQGAGG